MNQLLIDKRRGFTLIELLIGITISSLLFGYGITRYIDFNRAQTTRGVGQTLKNNFRDIQAKALAGIKPTTPCTELDGYITHFNQTNYQQFIACDGNLANISANTPLVTVTMPAGFQIGTTQGANFSTTVPDNILFRVIGLGAAVYNETSGAQVGTSQVVTLRAYSSPYRYYSLCVSGGGDIKDCGYSVNTVPQCTCP